MQEIKSFSKALCSAASFATASFVCIAEQQKGRNLVNPRAQHRLPPRALENTTPSGCVSEASSRVGRCRVKKHSRDCLPGQQKLPCSYHAQPKAHELPKQELNSETETTEGLALLIYRGV